jgi:hypothetical protein
MLTDHERATLFMLCEHHAVATCPRCNVSYRFVELGRGAVRNAAIRPYTCPTCTVDVTPSIVRHMHSCRNFGGQGA